MSPLTPWIGAELSAALLDTTINDTRTLVWKNSTLASNSLRQLIAWRRDQYLLVKFYNPELVNHEAWLDDEVSHQRGDDINILTFDEQGTLLAGLNIKQPNGLAANVPFASSDRPRFPVEELRGQDWHTGYKNLESIDACDAWEIGRFVRDLSRKDPTMRRATLSLGLCTARYVTATENQKTFRLLLGDLDPNVALGAFLALDVPVVMGETSTLELPDDHPLAPRYRAVPTAPFMVDLRDTGFVSETRWKEIEGLLSTDDSELEQSLDAFRARIATTLPRPSRLVADSFPVSHDDFYAEFTTRNKPLISDKEQRILRQSKILIAGCGSTGGACGMPLLRSGAEHIALLDPGTFELNNFNRQEASLNDLTRNKAVVMAERMHGVNPHAEIEIYPEGFVPKRARTMLTSVNLIVDAIDVTTNSGLEAKFALHKTACELSIPVVTAYDIAMRQYIEVFDYRRSRKPFDGRLDNTSLDDANAVLAKLLPLKALPKEIFPVITSRASDPSLAFPQLAMTANLLSAVIVPIAINLLMKRRMPKQMCFDLLTMTRTNDQRVIAAIRRILQLPKLGRTLSRAKKG